MPVHRCASLVETIRQARRTFGLPGRQGVALAARLGAALLLAASFAPETALAWGATGHHTIGAIADNLIAGTRTREEVRNIIGELTLEKAAVWADCAKAIDPDQDFAYTGEGRFAECAIFENPSDEASMADFVRRNHHNCALKTGEKSCHREYHYADVAIQRGAYNVDEVGARDDDIVQATVAAIRVLLDDPSPAPFDFANKREALLLLAHYVGDIHQPLHVGAVYLGADGARVDPDQGAFDPQTETRGGNSIAVNGSPKRDLHVATWDAVPASLGPAAVDRLTVAARGIAADPGDPVDWPVIWADESIAAAQSAFRGLRFSAKTDNAWDTTLPAGYSARMTTIKRTQITRAGARLARILQAIWP